MNNTAYFAKRSRLLDNILAEELHISNLQTKAAFAKTGDRHQQASVPHLERAAVQTSKIVAELKSRLQQMESKFPRMPYPGTSLK